MGEMVLVGTDDGLLVLDVDGRRAQAVTHAFMGRHITALAAASDSVLAAMMRYGVCRISAGERDAEWTLDAHVLSLASSPSAPHVCLAGAEPAALYRSDDGGRTWRELRALRCGPDADAGIIPRQPPHLMSWAWRSTQGTPTLSTPASRSAVFTRAPMGARPSRRRARGSTKTSTSWRAILAGQPALGRDRQRGLSQRRRGRELD